MNYETMFSVDRQWTDGYDLPWEGGAQPGGDLILSYALINEQFPKITREALRCYAAQRGDNPYALVKAADARRKLFGTDLGWVEVPYEDDLAAASGL